MVLYALGYGLAGYLSGSLPFSIWITRLFKGVDVREAGSGHATATNTMRQAGFGPGMLVLLLDLTKSFVPVRLALKYAPSPWVAVLTAVFVVIGHCWPIFAQFHGGMGLASAGGGLLAANPLAFLIAVAILILLTLIIHHGARASLVTGLVVAPVFWVCDLGVIEFWLAAALGIIIASRLLINWNRQYRELWLDREKS